MLWNPIILAPEGAQKVENVAVAALSAPVTGRLTPERAGRAYFSLLAAANRTLDISGSASPPPQASPLSSDGDAVVGVDDDEKYKKLLKKKIPLDDLYGLLGLEETNVDSTDKEIKAAYRKVSLLYHPDKAPPKEREFYENRFKALQVGYEKLIDPMRRRTYDSSIEFDDDVPGPKEGLTEADFYKVYGPVFKRNARFSEIKPVPELGGPDMPYDKVNAFYDFWLSLKSWRDFAHEDEHSLDGIDSREEKRYLQRKNEKVRAEKKKEEISRVRKFVEDAMRKDPRIKAQRKHEEDMKKKAKDDKNAKKREKELEIERAKEEAKKKEEEAKRQAEEEKNKQKELKQIAKKTRSTLRKTLKGGAWGVFDENEVEAVCAELEHAELSKLAEIFVADLPVEQITEEKKQEGAALFASYYSKLKSHAETERRKAEDALMRKRLEARKAVERAEEEKERPWTVEEESILAKAIVRYPPGAGKRWEQITLMINSIAPQPRTVKDVLKKAKQDPLELKNATADSGHDFELYQKKVEKKKESLDKSVMEQVANPNWERLVAIQEQEAAAQAAAPAAAEKAESKPKAESKKGSAKSEEKAGAKTEKAPAKASAKGGEKKAEEKKAEEKKPEEKKASQKTEEKKVSQKVEEKKVSQKVEEKSSEKGDEKKPAETKEKANEKPAQPQANDKKANGKQANGKQADGKQADGKKADGKQADGKQIEGKAAANGKQAGGKAAAAAPAAAAPAPAPAAEKKASSKGVEKAAAPAPKEPEATKVDDWSADEQFQFENALRSVPKGDAERWDKIAALVPTKTKKECVKRFKDIREQIINKK